MLSKANACIIYTFMVIYQSCGGSPLGGRNSMSKLVNNYLTYDENKLYTRLLAQFEVLGMNESIKALNLARKYHDGVVRKSTNQPYIVHPLLMASIAMAIGDLYDDTLIAVIILHDVVEDNENVRIEDLPVNSDIRRGVKKMTITKHAGETKSQSKVRYFNELLEDKNAVICKGLDRFVNLSTMAGNFAPNKIKKNVIETDQLLLPILREAKEKYPELTSFLYIIRMMVRSVNETLANVYDVELNGEQLYGGNDHYNNPYETEQ